MISIFLRGFLIVTCVAFNTRMIAALDYSGALLTGGLLSFIWWGNSRTAAHVSAPAARWAYTAGAALGTVTGMWLGR